MRHGGPQEFWRDATPLAEAEARAPAPVPGLAVDQLDAEWEKAAAEEAEGAGRGGWSRLRGMLDFMPHMFWSYHLDTGEEYLSRQWVSFTGVAGIARPGGARRLDLVHPDDRERAR